MSNDKNEGYPSPTEGVRQEVQPESNPDKVASVADQTRGRLASLSEPSRAEQALSGDPKVAESDLSSSSPAPTSERPDLLRKKPLGSHCISRARKWLSSRQCPRPHEAKRNFVELAHDFQQEQEIDQF